MVSGISASIGDYVAYVSSPSSSEQLSSESSASDLSLMARPEEDIATFFKSSEQFQALQLNRKTRQVKIARSQYEAKEMEAMVDRAIARLKIMPNMAEETVVAPLIEVDNINATNKQHVNRRHKILQADKKTKAAGAELIRFLKNNKREHVNKQHEILQVDKKAKAAGAELIRFLKNNKRDVEAVIVKATLSSLVTPFPTLSDPAELKKETMEYHEDLYHFQNEMDMFFNFFIEKLPDNEKVESKKLYADMVKYYQAGRKMRQQLIDLIRASTNEYGIELSQPAVSDFFSLLAGHASNLLPSIYT